VFSAGGDIPNMQRRIDDPELFNRKNVEMKRIVFGLIELEKPIVCRINGDCMGWAPPGAALRHHHRRRQPRGSAIRT